MVILEGSSISFIGYLMDFATETAAPALEHIGKGIASIMLMIVLFHYLVSMLDGGKFQLRMLMPLFIFFLVCNFSWIAKPVTAFTTTLTESVNESCDEIKNKITNNYYNASNTWEMISEKENERMPENDAFMYKELNIHHDSLNNATDDGTDVTSRMYKKGIESAIAQEKYNTVKALGGGDYADLGDTTSKKKKITILDIVGMSLADLIFTFFCDIAYYILMALAAVMTAIIVAFGPIIFAFAILPGHSGSIKTWFLRLCQFALYAPITSLINCFTLAIVDMLISNGIANHPMGLAITLANVVCLFSVPTISSMIIEGAQGAASISSAIQSMSMIWSIAATSAKTGMSSAGSVFNSIRNRLGGNSGGTGNTGGAANSN